VRVIGTTLGHYRIVDKIGEGGMGVVYRANDERLDRDVAIKVLPEAVAEDAQRLARFEREAKLLASLSHQNIATLYGLEEHEGQRFLVMELVEGETLADRIESGPIPVEDVLPVALQIAEGLEAAHEKGIIHRDLKPANVMVSPGGKVKVLDFGLAKVWQPDESDAGLTHSPTLTAQMTVAGVLLGTAAYMSPEQARGKTADKRADIWGFGCVLYEMLAGRPVFVGETVSDVLAAVMRDEPGWSSLPASTSPLLRRLLHWCLTKDLKQRLQHVGDARILLGDIVTGEPESQDAQASPAGLSWRRAVPIGLVLFLLGAAVTWVVTPRVSAPPAAATAATWDARPLTATGDAWNVALSSDGQTVAYLTAEGLVTHDVQGGSPNLVLPDSAWGRGRQDLKLGQPSGEPQWLHDGSAVAFTVPIDFATLGISAVPRMGGRITPKLLTSFAGGEVEASFQSLLGDAFLLARVLEPKQAAPWIRVMSGAVEEGIDLPPGIVTLWDAVASGDGRLVAYIGERADRTNVVGTITRDGTRHNVIVERGTELSKWAEMSINRQWAGNRIMRWPSGDRVYYRQVSARGIDVYAVTIDPDSGSALGDPELTYSGLPPGATFDVALEGKRLVYSGGVIKTQIRLLRFDADRGGDPIEDRSITRGTARHVAPRFSPDGRRLAYIRKTGRSEDIYIVPIAGGEAKPVNVLYRWNQVVDLKWSPEGEELAVFALTQNGPKLVIVSLSDSRVRELPMLPLTGTWFDWSPDGRWIAYGTSGEATYVLHEVDTGEEREIFEELQGEKIQSVFSPDGTELLLNNIGLAQPGLWAESLDGGAARLVTADASARTYPVRWSREGIIYLLGPEGRIFTVDALGGSPREFGRIPEAPIWEGWASLSIDGESLYLACAVDEPRESDVWVLDRIDP